MITTKAEAKFIWCLLTNRASEPGMMNVIGTQGCKKLAEGALAYLERERATSMTTSATDVAIRELKQYIKDCA